jgi:anaerobic selenocysteine-containing dehydrogenase
LDKGSKLIVIDPQKVKLASWADIWIKPRPGSDGALALAMIRVIIEERLYDEEFIANWTTGFDLLREHVKGYPLAEVEEITWVPRGQIEEAARLYAQTKPAAIQWGNALDHNINSFQTCRSISILRAISGNLDIPGGDIFVGTLPIMRPGRFMLLHGSPRERKKTIGSEFKLAARSAFIPREAAIKAILEDKPYSVKVALLFGTNPLLTYANAEETYNALMKLEFLVVSEFFMTPTAELADIVLPAAANFDFDEIAPYPTAGFIVAYPKIVEPQGECWSDMRMINELAKKLGLGEHFWADEREAIDLILKPSGLTSDEFKEKRVLQADKEYRGFEKAGFRTPSGKVEIYSQQLEELGYSPLPTYIEPPETPYSSPELAQEYPLVLTNAKSPSFYHSAYRNIYSLRRITPEPMVELNPDTAAKLGVKEGDWVYIETKRGRIRQKLSLNEALDPRVVVAAYGWWFPEKGNSELYGWRESNINILTPNAPPYEPALGSASLRGMLCRLSKA